MFVKVCGITSEEDALLAVAMGADALGFIFVPSQRQVTAELCSDIIKRLPPEILTVGVFRNTPPSRVESLVMASGVRAVQLHGMETSAEVAEVRAHLPLFMIKAVNASTTDLRRVDRFGADAVLLDSETPGSGQSFDWTITRDVPDDVKVIVSGGLTPTNVEQAIRVVRPWGVDVATGVESAPGKKDPRKLREFIGRARVAFSEIAAPNEVDAELASGAGRATDADDAATESITIVNDTTSPKLFDWERE